MQPIDLAIQLQIKLSPKAKLIHDFDINLKILSGNFRKKLKALIQERTKYSYTLFTTVKKRPLALRR